MMPDELAPLGYLGGVNRSAITITPKEPYLAWTRAVSAHEADPPTYISTRSATLLIPELDEAEASTYLRENSGAVFREMLTRWCRDQSKWPQGVDEWTTFTAWFEIRYALDVFDLDLEELERYGNHYSDEYDDDDADDADAEGDDAEEDELEEDDTEGTAWQDEIIELRLRPDLYDLLRALLTERPVLDTGLVAVLDAATQHRKGRVVRADQRAWSGFLHLLDAGTQSSDFVRAKLSCSLIALISESRGRKW